MHIWNTLEFNTRNTADIVEFKRATKRHLWDRILDRILVKGITFEAVFSLYYSILTLLIVLQACAIFRQLNPVLSRSCKLYITQLYNITCCALFVTRNARREK